MLKEWLAWKINELMDDISDAFSEKQICPTCAKPDKTMWHRRRCLRRSERDIYSQLRKNRELERDSRNE